MKCVFGLGNPGRQYQNTRHNIGFLTIDAFVSEHGSKFRRNCKVLAHQAEIKIQGEIVSVYKPYTFMNRSGESVKKVCSLVSPKISDILIVYDDVALPLGILRFRERGSFGGHRGLESIIEELGTSNVPRLRIGISSSECQHQYRELSDFVLGKFTQNELSDVESMIEKGTKAITDWVNHGSRYVMDKYNQKKM